MKAHAIALIVAACSACGRTVPDPPMQDGGRIDASPPEPPAYPRVAVGGQVSCSVDRTGQLRCWGAIINADKEPPSGVWADVDYGGFAGCALSPLGTLRCWGGTPGLAAPHLVPNDRFKKIAVASFHGCGTLQAGNRLKCWGPAEGGAADAPPGEFTDVTAGTSYSCGLRVDGTVICWGENESGQANAPDGSFRSISAGWYVTCGIRSDETVQCWGNLEFAPPTGLDAVQVSAGWRGVCVIRRSGNLECFTDGIAPPPPGRFVRLAFAEQHGCAVRDDGKILCWGSNSHGQATPPE